MLSLDVNRGFGWFQNKILIFLTKCGAEHPSLRAFSPFVGLMVAFSLVTSILLTVFLLETRNISVTTINREAGKFVC
jgi:hypothetical protein